MKGSIVTSMNVEFHIGTKLDAAVVVDIVQHCIYDRFDDRGKTLFPRAEWYYDGGRICGFIRRDVGAGRHGGSGWSRLTTGKGPV